jgi:hypothetical protein
MTVPLDFQTVDVKFTKGQDTRTQRKLVLPGTWDSLINLSLSEDGTPQRRDGAQPLLGSQVGNGLAARDDELVVVSAGAASTVSATAGASVAKQLPGALPYVDVLKAEVDFTTGYHDSLDVAYGDGFACYVWRDLSSSMGSAAIKCTLIDLASGAKLVNATTLNSAGTPTTPRVVFANNAFFVFYVLASLGNGLMCRVIQTSAPSTVGAETTIDSSASLSTENIDACTLNLRSGTQVGCLVAYRWTDGVTSLRAVVVKNTGTTPSADVGPVNALTEANVTVASIQGVAVAPFSTLNAAGVFLVKQAGGVIAGGLVGVVLDTALSVTAGPSNIDATVPAAATATHVTACSVGNSSMAVFFDQQCSYGAAAFRPLRGKVTNTTLGSVVAASTVLSSACFRVNNAEASGPQGPFIAGKVFRVNTSVYLPVCVLENFNRLTLNANVSFTDPTTGVAQGSTLSSQCAFYLLDVSAFVNATGAATNFVLAAGALYRTLGLVDLTLGGNPPTVQTPCSVSGPTTDGGYIIALQERGRLELVRGLNLTPVGISGITLTPRTTSGAVSAQLGESTYFAGGMLGAYDSKQVLEQGFPMFPEGCSAVVVASGLGNGLTVGVHQVVFVYEWTDGGGNRWQSAPSLPVTVTVVNANDQINCLVPTTQLPASAGYNANISQLSIVAYMTTASGLVLYRCPSSLVAPTLNNTGASTVSYVIGIPTGWTDAQLSGNEQLYTQPLLTGSTLPNIAPGPASALSVGQNRLWFLKADQPFAYGFSQALSANTGLQFNDQLGGTLPHESGGGVAIAMLDEKVIIFGKRRIYVVAGSPPDSSGANGTLQAPMDIQSDVGCSDARSVLGELPGGILFKAEQGWHMLGRDLSVTYVGTGVAAYDSQGIRSAVLMGDRKEARFVTDAGAVLVFSTLQPEPTWSVFVYGNSTPTLPQPVSGEAIADAVWWPALERFVWVSTTRGLNNDVPGVLFDSIGPGPINSVVTTLARTGFLKPGALEGYQRVRRLYGTATGTNTTSSTLRITIYFDDAYDATGNLVEITFFNTLALATSAPSVESIDFRHIIANLQKCKSIAFMFQDTPADTNHNGLTGLQAIALEIGLKSGVRRLPAAQSS